MINLKNIVLVFWGASLSFLVIATEEPEEYTPASVELLKRLEGKIKATLFDVVEHEMRAGNDVDNLYYSLLLPAKQHINLGLLLDLDNTVNGYQVVSVTPGSIAEGLGIKTKDIILEINNEAVGQLSSREVLKRLYDLQPSEELVLGINSGGKYKELTTELSGTFVPKTTLKIGTENSVSVINARDGNKLAQQGCGMVSATYPSSTFSEFRAVRMHQIDGEYVSRTKKHAQLSVGKHTLSFIVNGYNMGTATIEMDIEANRQYFMAAKKITNSENDSESSWEPYAWKTSNKKCEQ